MNESAPLKIDARSLLEATVSGIGTLIVGVNQIGLDDTYALAIGLILLAVMAFVNRLLGKNATDAVNRLSAVLDQALARNNVLVSDASPTTIRKADEAAESIAASTGAPPKAPAP